MKLATKLLSASSFSPEKLYVDDVFSTYLYTGTGTASAYNIVNGIDLSANGGLVWIKGRSYGGDRHILVNSAIGAGSTLSSNLTDAVAGGANSVSALNSDGFTIGNGASSNAFVNRVSTTFASWTFRNADKFYNHAVVTKSAGSNATVSFANLGTLGMVRVKRTDSTGSWYIWHRSLSAGQLVIGETTAAAATLGHVTVSGTTVTLVNAVIADGTYLVEAFAHDDSADGIIQCGLFTTDGSGNATVSLGWEPQFCVFKSFAGGTSNWHIVDAMRGMVVSGADAQLFANTSSVESTAGDAIDPSATGFSTKNISSSRDYLYLAIRRPNKPPTTGTQVYNAIARTGTGAAATVTGVGFAPDLVTTINKDKTSFGDNAFFDRTRGANKELGTNDTDAEVTSGSMGFDVMDGIKVGASDNPFWNNGGVSYINHFFRRAPGVFDIVCYTGTGAARTVPHSLGVVPELMIVKGRTSTPTSPNWAVYHSALGNQVQIQLNFTNAVGGASAINWNNTTPTSSVFTVGSGNTTGASGQTYVAYLFATKAGISKVGSYTGNGSSQTINCGFSTGARFVLIKRTDSTGNWLVADTARGLVSAADNTLYLNSTAAEITGVDWIDPDSTGFSVTQEGTMNANVNGASYVFLAVA